MLDPKRARTHTQVSGIFTVSLDLELHWGMTDVVRLSPSYMDQLRRTRDIVIPRLLKSFDEAGVHATWATVGFLMFETRRDLLDSLPDQLPHYADPNLSTYRHFGELGAGENDDPYHFAASIVRAIQDYAHQEIGSHSFAHYYTLEAGHRAGAFEADIDAWAHVAAGLGVSPQSICFPRNQYDPSTLEICEAAGIATYRGNEPSWCYRPRPAGADTLLRKLVRRLDTYLPVTGHHTPRLKDVGASTPYNVASSRFLRAYHRPLAPLEPLKRKRILAGMTHAAQTGGIYHLWWHPQDFGVDTEENFAMLATILEHFNELSERYGMTSHNMAEIGDLCRSAERAPMNEVPR